MPVIVSDPTLGNKAVVLIDRYFHSATLAGEGDGTLRPAVNAITDSTYDSWSPASGVATRLTKTGSGVNIAADGFGFAGHNLATTNTQIWVQWSDDQVTWTDAFPRYTPLTDEPHLFLFPWEKHVYWRVSMLGSVDAFVSNVKLGERLEFPCTPIDNYTPTHHAKVTRKYFNRSINGQFLGTRVQSIGGTTQVSFPAIARSFVDGPLLQFEEAYRNGRTFFYAGWPTGKPQDVAYCRPDGDDAILDVTYIQGSKLANLSFGVEMYGG